MSEEKQLFITFSFFSYLSNMYSIITKSCIKYTKQFHFEGWVFDKQYFYFFSCPFDYMTIYDGEDNFAEKIGTYCGQLRNLVIFSTNNKLFVTFTTLKRTAPVQNRGFSGLYEFSEDFVRLGKLFKCKFV